jgi:hypothetical protein
MKKIFLFILVAIIPLSILAHSAFCDGFKVGYKNGYCYGDNFCIAPIPPICPIPHIGENSYADGYNRGFLEGLNDR